MFISKAEKEDLFYRIWVLEQTIIGMKSSLANLSEAKTQKGRNWSPEQRAEASARMKAHFAKAKKENA